jgi:FKBP-type peptidyl-prolyl cis-trans isomerase
MISGSASSAPGVTGRGLESGGGSVSEGCEGRLVQKEKIKAMELTAKKLLIVVIKNLIFNSIGVFKSIFKGYAENMRHIHQIAVAVAVLLCILTSCNADNGDKTGTGPALAETFSKDASYALGMEIGSGLKSDEIYPNIDEFVQGLRDTLSDSQARFTIEQSYQILNEAFNSLSERRENTFLVENSKKPGINVTRSGLQYEIIREGTGSKPTALDTVKVHYQGSLTNGTVFDSSYSWGEPVEFPLNGVIPGWTEGLQLMEVGSVYRLIVPSNLAYGPQGRPQIPPYSTLIFEIELLDIIR